MSNLMAVHLLAGRWQEADHIAAQFLDDDDGRAGAEFIHYALVFPLALRGDRDAAKARLARIAAWQRSEAAELRAVHTAATISVNLAGGRTREALEQGWSMLPGAINALGVAHDAVRHAWPATLEAATQSGHSRALAPSCHSWLRARRVTSTISARASPPRSGAHGGRRGPARSRRE